MGWGMSFLSRKIEYMHRTNNIILHQAAKDLSRELRKSQKDNLRTQILNSLDIRILRFHNEDVENELDQVLRENLKKF
jgi:hypothetical protein